MLFNVQLAEINLKFNFVGSIKKGILLTSAVRILVKKSVNRMFFSEIMVRVDCDIKCYAFLENFSTFDS